LTDIFIKIQGVDHVIEKIEFKKKGKQFEIKFITIGGQIYKANNLDFWSVFNP